MPRAAAWFRQAMNTARRLACVRLACVRLACVRLACARLACASGPGSVARATVASTKVWLRSEQRLGSERPVPR